MAATILISVIVALVLLAFALLAAKDLILLFTSPTKKMGPGILRIWAVARTAIFEAWASRIWLLPILWFIASVILLLTVRPFEESDRIPLYIRVLLTSQEILLLVMFWVMACISFPRDRERKIVITNASKPLSRLEIMLGKITGFVVAAFALLIVMGAVSYGLLLVANQHIRATAAAEYQLAENDYQEKSHDRKEATLPPQSLKNLAEDGSLFAYNHITVPLGNMSIVGDVKQTSSGLVRFLKGGSSEKVIYHFSPNIPGAANADLGGPGQRPFFAFRFPVYPLDPQNPPPRIALDVTAVRSKQQLRPQEKTIYLDPQNGGAATWEPDNIDEIFSLPGQRDNGDIEVTVSCPTPGVFLQILEGVPREKLSAATFNSFNVAAFPTRDNPPDVTVPLPHPEVRGFERRDKQQVSGPTKREIQEFGPDVPLEVAVFRFPAKDIRHVPIDNGKFQVSMMLDVDKESNQSVDTYASVEAYNENSPTETFQQSIHVIEKRPTLVDVPEKFLGGPDLDKRGDLVVLLRCQTEGHWLSVLEDSVRIEQPPAPFVLNLAKSELVIFCEAALLIVICVVCSVRLGWPVAMLLAATCVILGFLRGFVSDIHRLGGLGALGYQSFGQPSSSYKFFDTLLAAVWSMEGFLVSLTPDFSRYDSLEYIVQLRNMPWEVLGLDALWTVIYALPFIAIGYLLIRKQELG